MQQGRKFFAGLLAASAAFAIIAGCGGGGGDVGGGGTTVAAGRSQANVYVTDKFSDNYSQVLVTLYKIEVSSDGTNYTTVYTDAGGESVDVASLSTTAQLLSTVTLPSGNYTKVRITTGDSFMVVPKGGTASQTLAVDGTAPGVTVANGMAVIVLNANSAFPANQLSNLVVDFDLSSFILSGGKVRPAVGLAAAAAFSTKTTINVHLAGTVTSLNPGVSFVLESGGSRSITVNLSSSTAEFSDADGTNVTLANGQNVAVDGTLDKSSLTINATAVRVTGTTTTTAVNAAAFGTVATVDATASSFTLTVTAGEHIAQQPGTVTVVTNANTKFSKPFASAADFAAVTATSPVIVSGTYDPTTQTLTARRVTIF